MLPGESFGTPIHPCHTNGYLTYVISIMFEQIYQCSRAPLSSRGALFYWRTGRVQFYSPASRSGWSPTLLLQCTKFSEMSGIRCNHMSFLYLLKTQCRQIALFSSTRFAELISNSSLRIVLRGLSPVGSQPTPETPSFTYPFRLGVGTPSPLMQSPRVHTVCGVWRCSRMWMVDHYMRRAYAPLPRDPVNPVLARRHALPCSTRFRSLLRTLPTWRPYSSQRNGANAAVSSDWDSLRS
eukprot:3610508-Rhodomonas_salina.1